MVSVNISPCIFHIWNMYVLIKNCFDKNMESEPTKLSLLKSWCQSARNSLIWFLFLLICMFDQDRLLLYRTSSGVSRDPCLLSSQVCIDHWLLVISFFNRSLLYSLLTNEIWKNICTAWSVSAVKSTAKYQLTQHLDIVPELLNISKLKFSILCSSSVS